MFEEYQGFVQKYGDLRYVVYPVGYRVIVELMGAFTSVLPTRYFLGRPDTGEEMHIEIEKGKMLIVRLMATGPIVEGRAQRDVWFEVNGEVGFIIAIECAMTHRGQDSGCFCRGQELRRRNRLSRAGDIRPRFGWRTDVGCSCRS